MSESSLKIVSTKDGSQTILNEELGSTYHSRHGALTESQHVFIAKGLEKVIESGMTEITILEMGFGTGLNTLLTAIISVERNIRINYHTLELFPLPESIWMEYQLPDELAENRGLFDSIHGADWNKDVFISSNFSFAKHHISLLDFEPSVKFDLVYYDAFEPETQPELWTQDVFEKLFSWMNPKGVLTTYCCKGYARRNMLGAGFEVTKVPGPPGKREMIVANRPL
ncbi:MAG: tRNA (5-methylaminomethyl-2-thiouridine)(34)-methyltransferase MnmD [Flavobacteriales bacterium]|jgi:tRNA U34 5-methylaminomethyl-2-thiouridine-forming methyltransferase MnmC|nr:tRNA (5-methylaminomethyl-2-thiouridine)(34)-methyltransferase MnmD [Flavobacteriales bacterium]